MSGAYSKRNYCKISYNLFNNTTLKLLNVFYNLCLITQPKDC